jgi:3-hydroxy-9,10-secoandrosta-1,3,5(10)-triene-9,17-dione monooxygenase reductase component
MFERRPAAGLDYRHVLGHFPTGVAVVTAIGADRKPIGMAVNSFTSASLHPPLIAFFPAQSSTSFPKMQSSPAFCINILAQDQEGLSRRFAKSHIDRFEGVSWRPAPSGAPILDGVLAWIDSEPTNVSSAGDHFVVLCRVCALGIEDTARRPLIFFQSNYGGFTSHSARLPR